jgi:hypothetical protein
VARLHSLFRPHGLTNQERGIDMISPQGLSVADVVAIWGISTGSVYRLASEHGWRRYRESGRTLYHPLDVSSTLSDRSRPEGVTCESA